MLVSTEHLRISTVYFFHRACPTCAGWPGLSWAGLSCRGWPLCVSSPTCAGWPVLSWVGLSCRGWPQCDSSPTCAGWPGLSWVGLSCRGWPQYDSSPPPGSPSGLSPLPRCRQRHQTKFEKKVQSIQNQNKSSLKFCFLLRNKTEQFKKYGNTIH